MNAIQEAELLDRLVDEEGLNEADARAAIPLLKRGEILATVWETHMRSVEHGLPSPLVGLKAISDFGAEMKRVNDALEELLPPMSDEEREAIDAEIKAEREAKELRRQVIETTKEYLRRAPEYDRLLSDIPVDRRYRAVTEHVVRFALKHLAPGMPPASVRVKFFSPSYFECAGFFKDSEPLTVYIRDGLEDRDLVSVVCHEIGHLTGYPDDLGEERASAAEAELVPLYVDQYGRGHGSAWSAAA